MKNEIYKLVLSNLVTIRIFGYYLWARKRIKGKCTLMKESVLLKKSFEFSVEVYSFCNRLREEKFDYAIVNQLIKSGTAIAALVREAEYAQSRPDFISKLSIALKEANETIYWIELVKAVKKEVPGKGSAMYSLVSEIKGILIASIKTAKRNLRK